MRVAVLVIGLVLGAIMTVQTFLVTSLSGVADDQASGQAGAVGLLMALLWLVAVALVMALPMISVFVFAIAGLLGFAVAKDFPDLQVWGVASLLLAAMSLLGWFGKRKAARQQAAHDAQLLAVQQATAQQAAMALEAARRASEQVGLAAVACPGCGMANTPGTRFCHECGTAMSVSGAQPAV